MPSVLGLGGLHPEVRRRVSWLLELARKDGLRVTVTSTLRSHAKQLALYKAWLQRGQTGLPAAVPGYSTHEYGLAVDLVTDDVKRLAELAQCSGLHWAGPGDRVHFDPFGFAGWRDIIEGREPRIPPYRC